MIKEKINTIYEIRIVKQATVEYAKKVLGKSVAISLFRQIPKLEKQRKFPIIILVQNNYGNEGILTSSVELLKSRINIDKMSVEQVKNLLQNDFLKS